jgi:hypothetical protein
MTGAERQLPQYADLLEARLRKEEEHISYSIAPSAEAPEMFEFQLDEKLSSMQEVKEYHNLKDIASDQASTEGGIWEKIFKPSKKSSRASEKRPQKPKKTFVETFVENFKSFLSV